MSGEGLTPPIHGDQCGAGHWCCTDPNGPPLHDHFLEPKQCPGCREAGSVGRLGKSPEPSEQMALAEGVGMARDKRVLHVNCEYGPKHCNLYGVPHEHWTASP